MRYPGTKEAMLKEGWGRKQESGGQVVVSKLPRQVLATKEDLVAPVQEAYSHLIAQE